MSTRQFTITVFHLIIFVLTPLVVFADEPADELGELPPVPTFRVPSEPKDEAKKQSEKVAEESDDNEIEDWDELPPVPTYKPQFKPKDKAKEQSEKNDEKPDDKRERLMKEAESGNAEAAMELAKEAEKRNFIAAVEQWLKVAAEAGSAEAWYKLGLIAIEKDDDNTAFECLKKSADAGYEDGKIYLAFGYMEGLGTKKDVEKGKALLQSVADSGNVTAIRKLANAYRLGIGFERDEQKALDLLTQLYQNAKDDSTRVMAAANLWGMNDKDGLKRADELLDNVDLSALQTLASANVLSLLSVSLLEHYFQNTDNDKAIAQKRFSRLMDMLLNAGNWEIDEGTLYAVMKVCEDKAIVPDSEKTRLFQAMDQLASRGNPVAMLCLSYLYIKGIGTEKNRYMFDYWLDKSASYGYAPAQYYAFILLRADVPEMGKRKDEYLKLASNAQFPNARYLYLMGCLNGREDSSEEIEKKKIALVESEGLIEQYLKDRKENSQEGKDNGAALPVSEQYLKWGRGCMSVDYSKIRGKEIQCPTDVDVSNPDNTISDLWQYDSYVNIGDLIYRVACCYKEETAGCSFDREKVRELLSLAMELGNRRVWFALIYDYWMSDEDEKAFEELKKAMDDNKPWAFLAQFIFTCYNPDGTENFEQAFPYLQKAVELDAGRANKYLGMCYILGKGVKQDVKKGVQILEDNKEYVMLMLLYGKGLGVEQDTEKSKRYFAMELARDGINDNGKITIGEIDEGKFCFKRYSYEEALICAEFYLYFNKYCLKRMEKEGVSHAATFWGLSQTNEKSMRTILRNAAKQGDAFDKATAGGMLLTRSNDQQLKQEGEEALRKAAQSGQTMAMVILGLQSVKAGGKEDDPARKMKLLKEGRQWLKQAADKGNMLDYLDVTEMFIDSGIPVDLEEYHRYLDLAVELNYAKAMLLKAAFLSRSCKPEETAEVQSRAEKLIQQAAELGSPIAKDLLQHLDNYKKQRTDEFNAKFHGNPNKDYDYPDSSSKEWFFNKEQKSSILSSPFDSSQKSKDNNFLNGTIPSINSNMRN
ncbi:MAG: sel1 repeat family protein [Thermoguttaceae bacterium]|nr:sel1 repeat family protein [Thermoguttaceae bacterium]